MKNIFHRCVQGEVNGIYEYLKGLDHRTEVQKSLMRQYYNRFFKAKPDYTITHDDSWIEDVINTYRSYFIDVLTKKIDHSVAELALIDKLNSHLPLDVRGSDINSTEENIKAIFTEKGFSFKGGRVVPHYGPFIWETTVKRMYQVDLLDTTEEVQVYFLDDFLMLSWLHFATFGEVYAGGWAEKDALYCILPRYQSKLEADAFLVSFLKHEAQHYSDYRQFPMLKGPDLEYRAKLVELIYYSDYELFEKLLIQAVKNNNPHNYSSFILIERFTKHFFNKAMEKRVEKWNTINYEEIRQFALKLFDEHTVRLKSQGADTVEGVI